MVCLEPVKAQEGPVPARARGGLALMSGWGLGGQCQVESLGGSSGLSSWRLSPTALEKRLYVDVSRNTPDAQEARGWLSWAQSHSTPASHPARVFSASG